ncbi:MAG: diguanylate cyclase domain-containing protein [Pseudanabaena sp.]|nr:GGDEF domain-containing protein [Pseudanabaena sp. 42896M_M3]
MLKRPTDLTARYVGEEFVVVLCNTNLEGALKVDTEIQRAIAYKVIEKKYLLTLSRYSLSALQLQTYAYTFY